MVFGIPIVKNSSTSNVRVLNIGLGHFPLLLQNLVSLLFTPPLPSNPISHQLSHREGFYLLVVS